MARRKEARADFLGFLSPLFLSAQVFKLIAAAETLAGRRAGGRQGVSHRVLPRCLPEASGAATLYPSQSPGLVHESGALAALLFPLILLGGPLAANRPPTY